MDIRNEWLPRWSRGRRVAPALALVLGMAVPVAAQVGSVVGGVPTPLPQGPAPAGDTRPQTQPVAAGTASISGRITVADTGQGLARAKVIAYAFDGAGGSASPFGTETDTTGHYVISDLSAGNYLLTVTRVGYLQRQFGQQAPRGLGRRVPVAEGTRVSGADVALLRGAVVTGVVTDPLGEPAPGIPVKLLASHGWRGQSRFHLFQQLPTDDRGRFRMHGLAPGEYLLLADPHTGLHGVRIARKADDGHADLVRTFAPGVPDVSGAQRLETTAGQELTVDIQLLTGRLATVAGRVVDSKGEPLQRTTLVLVPDAAEIVVDRLAYPLNSAGEFMLHGVPPGEYTLHVSAPLPLGPIASPDVAADVESATLPIVVPDTGLDELLVATAPPSTVTGRLIVEGDATVLRGNVLLVSGWARDAERMPGAMGRGPVHDDLSIRVSGLAGYQVLRLLGLPRGWWVKDVRINGLDALHGFDFGTGLQLTGLEIVVNSQAPRLAGQVTTARGEPAADAFVLVVPDDLDRFHGFVVPGHGATVRADQNGTFVVDSIRPGTYHLVAMDAGGFDYRVLEDHDRLRELSLRAPRVTLSEGKAQHVQIRLDDP